MKKMRKIMAVFVMIFLTAASAVPVDAADAQISTTVPDSHNIRVEKNHATVAFEEEETQDEEGISDNFVVDRFAEPTIHIEAEKGWKIQRILLGDQDVTSQLKDGYLTLEPVSEDMTLTIETAEETSSGGGGAWQDKDKDKGNPGAGKDQNPGGKPADTLKKWKAAVTGDAATPVFYILIMAVAAVAGIMIVRLRRRK